MDARTTTSSQATDLAEFAIEPGMEPKKISAYYSLVFPDFTYYLQTLSVTIGRRCTPSTASSSDSNQVDVDLGPLKSVSRLHARIEYEEEEERFVLVVIGRNGAWVDGVWSGRGSRVSLSERSQIQIASRMFHFVLPPPPAPEDSPSPSSQSSANRPRSPSVDITSISPPSSMPSHSPPPTNLPRPLPGASPPSEPQFSNTTVVSNATSTSRKRKKPNPVPSSMPKPEGMPSRPPLTYAQLCYRAIKAMGDKATLQEINHWIMESFDWYKYNDAGWQSSVRHNLSSNPAFKKMERCPDAKRKGFFWSVDEKFVHTFEEQEARSKLQEGHKGKEGRSIRRKEKGASILDPPLKRSVKMDSKGGVLPPPLTSAPLAPRTSATINSASGLMSSYSQNFLALNSTLPSVKAEFSAPQTPESKTCNLTQHTSGPTPLLPGGNPGPSNESHASSIPPLPPSLFIPIIVGPIPPSHPSSLSANAANTNPLASNAIVLHESTLILNPDVFSHLTSEQVKELEALGAQKALEILQGYIARFLKEQRLKRREGGRGRGRVRGASKRGRGSMSNGPQTAAEGAQSTDTQLSCVKSGPFTTAPLPLREAQQRPDGEVGRKSAGYRNEDGTLPTCADSNLSAHVPMAETTTVVDPIIIVDDPDAPVAKRRKLDALDVSPVS